MSNELSEPGVSNLWESVSKIRFCISDHVTVHPVEFRGKQYYLLKNGLDQKKFRLNQHTFQLVEQMNGEVPLADICKNQIHLDQQPHCPDQTMLQLVVQLQSAGILTSDRPRDPEAIVLAQRSQRKHDRLSRTHRMLSPRFALLNPDGMLDKSKNYTKWMFTRTTLWFWTLVVISAMLQALFHWDELLTYGAQRLDDPLQWIIMVAVYPIVKLLHELAHCLAAKNGGASIQELGITFLVFIPLPYVDASEVSLSDNKRQRILVGAAGIMMELFLASIAMLAWITCNDGMPRDIAYSVMLICGISTILFNGNPLLRFDGYFILMDVIEIPNLGTRASKHCRYLFKRHVLGLNQIKAECTTASEHRWFVFYGVISFIYRTTICIAVAAFFYITVPVLGLLVAIWLITIQLLLPFYRAILFLICDKSLNGRRFRALGTLTGGLLLFTGVTSLPIFPSSTLLEGVVLLPQQATVRAGVDGFLSSEMVMNKSEVSLGQKLFKLTNQQLDTELIKHKWTIKELEARLDSEGFNNTLAREILTERIVEARDHLRQLELRHGELYVTSTHTGVVNWIVNDDHIGQLIKQGEALAYVNSGKDASVRVVASQQDAARIRNGAFDIDVKLLSAAGDIIAGRLVDEVPLASNTLPSSALGSHNGGAIQADARDVSGLTAIDRVFAFDISVPATHHALFIGGRALVRFSHARKSLLPRWHQSLFQAFKDTFQIR